MKITNITTYLAKEWRTFMFVVVDTDEGIYGVGEAGITGRELAMAGAIEHFTPLLIGQNPFRTEHIWQTLFRGSFYPAGLILAAAIAAIDIALWDIKGKALGVPVYDLLGGLVRDKVMTYNHLHADSVAGLVARCQESVAEGWKVVRWEPTYRPDHVIEPRESIRLSLQQFEAV
jgi:galactonate dehydratase